MHASSTHTGRVVELLNVTKIRPTSRIFLSFWDDFIETDAAIIA